MRAVVAAVAGVVLAAGLGAAGYVAIANTTDGNVVGGGAPEVTFPATPTATLAVVDSAGALTSVAVLTARPDEGEGSGGTVVPVPINADSSGGFGDERLPLNETVALFGAESLGDEVPVLLGVGIDETTVVDPQALRQLLAPIGAIDVDLPAPVTGTNGEVLFAAGPQTLDADDVVAVLSAHDPDLSGADRYPIDVAVWEAIADVVVEGLESPLVSPGQAGVDVLSRVTSGPMSVQPLRSSPVVALDANPRGVDAAILDRAEVLVVFGHVAPGKVAAPNPGYNFRVVSRLLRRPAGRRCHSARRRLHGDRRRSSAPSPTSSRSTPPRATPPASPSSRSTTRVSCRRRRRCASCSDRWRCVSPTRGSPVSTSSSPLARTTSAASTPPLRPRYR